MQPVSGFTVKSKKVLLKTFPKANFSFLLAVIRDKSRNRVTLKLELLAPIFLRLLQPLVFVLSAPSCGRLQDAPLMNYSSYSDSVHISLGRPNVEQDVLM